MENKSNFLPAIVSEKDLNIYENYLNKDTAKYPVSIENPKNNSLPNHLHNHIGKLIKTESVIGETVICKIGKLLQVGNNFLVVKLPNACATTVIELSSVKFITIVHDNSKIKLF